MNPKAIGKFYRLVVGRKQSGAIKYPYLVGKAYYIEEDNYYLVRLSMFPQISYFLKKSNRSQNGYNVFADYVRDHETTRFQNPIGFGRLAGDLKTHLEVRLPLLSRTVFMDLFPVKEDETE